MSVEVIARVLADSPTSGNAKVILLGVANHAHPDGSHAFPSVPTLGRYARVSRRTVQRALRDLEHDGHIVREGFGPHGQIAWRVAFPQPPLDFHDEPQKGRQRDAPEAEIVTGVNLARGVTGVTGGASPVSPEPSFNQRHSGSPAVVGRASARAAAPAPSRTISPSESVDATTDLAEHVRGILQRGIDGLTSDAPAKPPTLKAVRDVLAKHAPPRDVAVAVAIDVRSIAQSQNRAPNICALFAQRLAELPQRPAPDARSTALRELGEQAAQINERAEAAA